MSGLPRAVIRNGREKSLRRRHPWVFSGAVARVDAGAEPGRTVEVVDSAGAFLARAAVSPSSQIRLRVWSFDEEAVIDAGFFRRRIEAAIALRTRLGLMRPTGACRVIYSEADGLPGLIVDRYCDRLVCQFLSAGSEHWRETLLALLAEGLAPRGIVERSDAATRRKEGLPTRSGVISGTCVGDVGFDDVLAGRTIRFLVDPSGGQKTGAYLDQALNRQRIAEYADGARMLDAYSYAGAFSMAALAGGAVSAHLIDSSADALELARRQASANDVADRCRFEKASVPEALRRLADAGQRFDLIVLDPPKFVHSAAQVSRGSRGYKDINLFAMRLLAPGGILATFTCSGHVGADLFRKIIAGAACDAGRDLKILERLSQAPDHPVPVHFPQAEYLNGLILRADA